MAEYIDREKLLEQIKEPVNWTDSEAELQEQVDYQAFKNMVENAPTEDVVPRSEVERLQAQNETLEIIVKDLRFRNKEFQKANEGLAKSIENLEIENDILREAKQEVAKQIFEEIEKFVESDSGKVICEDNGNDWFAKETAKTFEISHNIGVIDAKNALRDLLDELKKKYIGE